MTWLGAFVLPIVFVLMGIGLLLSTADDKANYAFGSKGIQTGIFFFMAFIFFLIPWVCRAQVSERQRSPAAGGKHRNRSVPLQRHTATAVFSRTARSVTATRFVPLPGGTGCQVAADGRRGAEEEPRHHHRSLRYVRHARVRVRIYR